MPALEVANENNDESSSQPINPVVGIIYPPPEVRSILLMHKYSYNFLNLRSKSG